MKNWQEKMKLSIGPSSMGPVMGGAIDLMMTRVEQMEASYLQMGGLPGRYQVLSPESINKLNLMNQMLGRPTYAPYTQMPPMGGMMPYAPGYMQMPYGYPGYGPMGGMGYTNPYQQLTPPAGTTGGGPGAGPYPQPSGSAITIPTD
jgi:hypothetical protein